ncbi:uncharacterized protein LOC126687745 [Mercurialis annua]|uniref:uncharacterized protein LOC126687745 n=1 Tax=Mercurialis annua TaxID=3986 RepID=UPI00215E461D|nr:uncharacterized protein LOC126687745 [Mercurialis annua]
MDPNAISYVPLWIQLPGLPWEFWTIEILSKIRSFCGTPLYSDQCTISKVKLNFARVLVEMEVAGPFPEVPDLQDENGNVFKQKIVYEWRPLFCDKCYRMGHSIKNCRVTQNTKKALEKSKASSSSKKGDNNGKERSNSFSALVDIAGTDIDTGEVMFSSNLKFGSVGDGRKARLNYRMIDID